MRTNIRYVLLCALRDKLFVGLLAGVIIATIISAILGSTAFIEEKEMTLTFSAASARLILVLGLIVFVCFHIRSSFDTREIDVMLSRPISRGNLVLAYWLGFSLVATILAVPTIAIVGLIGAPSIHGYINWAASLVLELWFVVALALFAALVMKSAVSSVMATLGFYVLSRMMAFFLLSAHSMFGVDKFVFLKYVLDLISTLMPRLDLFAKSEWLMYGLKNPNEWSFFLLQAAIYIPLLLVASIIDFKRKQF